MLPPMMPLVDDALWFGFFAGVAFLVWKAADRFDLRLALPDLRRPFARAPATAAPVSAWFTTTVRSSGNTAFDEWRDAEITRIEAQRRALETRLVAFEGFVDKLKRAKDRETFDRFTAQFRQEAYDDASGIPIPMCREPHVS